MPSDVLRNTKHGSHSKIFCSGQRKKPVAQKEGVAVSEGDFVDAGADRFSECRRRIAESRHYCINHGFPKPTRSPSLCHKRYDVGLLSTYQRAIEYENIYKLFESFIDDIS